MKSALSAFALGLLLLSSVPRAAISSTASTSFGVSITVQSLCLVSASAVPIGAFAIAPLKAISNVSVSCTHPTPYDVSLRSDGWAVTNSQFVELNTGMTGPGVHLPSYAFISSSNVIPITNLSVASFPGVLREAVALTSSIEPKPRSFSARSYPHEVTVVITY